MHTTNFLYSTELLILFQTQWPILFIIYCFLTTVLHSHYITLQIVMQPTWAHQIVRIFYSYPYSCWGHSSEINENPMEWDKAAYVERGEVWLSNNNVSWSTLSLAAHCIPVLLEEGAVLSPTKVSAAFSLLNCTLSEAEPREHLWVTWGLSQLPPELIEMLCRWQWEHIASHHQDFLCTLYTCSRNRASGCPKHCPGTDMTVATARRADDEDDYSCLQAIISAGHLSGSWKESRSQKHTGCWNGQLRDHHHHFFLLGLLMKKEPRRLI